MKLEKRADVKAVLGEEFEKVLVKLGVSDDFSSGSYDCRICQQQITKYNVLMIYPINHELIGFICRNPGCRNAYIDSQQPD